jgi:hypothetical protein
LTIYTIADLAFLPALAGLVNSLRAARFDGEIVVGTPKPLPAAEDVDGVRTVPLDDGRWPGLLKPDLLLQADGPFLFLDADLVVPHADALSRLASLIELGPLLALEGLVAPTDHRRLRWAARMEAPPPLPHAWQYYNSGFLAGRMPRDRDLLQAWAAGQSQVLAGQSRHFQDADFPFPDQDVLNAVMQRWEGRVTSLQFPDWWSAVAPANPFLHFGALPRTAFYHGIGEKPWQLKAVPSRNPTAYEELWFHFAVSNPEPMRVPVSLPDTVARWLSGHWSGHLRSRGKRLGQRLIGR